MFQIKWVFLLVQLLKNLLAFLNLLFGIIQEVHLKSPVFCLFLDLSYHFPVMKRTLLESKYHWFVYCLEVSQACSQFFADKMLF